MRAARRNLILLGTLALIAPACGGTSQHAPSKALQNDLRALATGGPHGDRAYWLGPAFDGAPVRFADDAWGRYAILTYSQIQDVDVDVESFRAHASGGAKGFPVRVHTAGGQDVVLVFHVPARPPARLIRAAKAALEPIPLRVVYPG